MPVGTRHLRHSLSRRTVTHVFIGSWHTGPVPHDAQSIVCHDITMFVFLVHIGRLSGESAWFRKKRLFILNGIDQLTCSCKTFEVGEQDGIIYFFVLSAVFDTVVDSAYDTVSDGMIILP